MSFLKKFKNLPEETIATEPAVEESVINGVLKSEESNDETITYFLSGKIDVNNFEEVKAQLLKELNISKIILDMEKVTYFSSAGLRMLFEFKTACDAKGIVHSIERVDKNVYNILKMTGYTNLLNIIAPEEQ